MEKSKLLEVFKTLDKQEVKDFGKYLEGNGYKKGTQVHDLFLFIAKQYPDFDSKKIDKNYVIKKMGIKVSDNIKRLQSLMNRLFASLEDYIIKVQLEKETVDKDFLLLKALQDRKLDKFFFSKAENLEKEWEKANIKGIDHLFDIYKLSKMCTLHPNLSDSDLFLYHKKLKEELEMYFFTESSYVSLITSHTVEDNNQFDDLTKSILSKSKLPEYQKNPQLKILSGLLRDKIDNNIDNYDILFTEFKNSHTKFNEAENWDILNLLEYYCLQNYHRGKKEYLQKMFELYVFGAKKQIILENGIIDDTRFRQIVLVGCSVNELTWIEKFIDEYTPFLNGQVQHDTVQYCKAILDFNKGNFEKVLEKLTFVKFKDVRYGIQARALLLQTYYELEVYEEQFFSLINSLSTYLRRNANLKEVIPLKESCTNFIKYIKKLQILRNDPNENMQSIVNEIKQENRMSNKLWLLQKANQI